ncbi:hypothetical protein DMA11_14335 [Marinilabiliaceae bacterium JC017]|nr:hypothetical protein DMA11_14335 [Marinilabiliaceae bacterium JC017]
MTHKARGICFLLVVIILGMPFRGEGIPFNQTSDKTISLNGKWKLKVINNTEEVLISQFYEPAFNDSSWQSINVPSNWEMHGFEKAQYYFPKTDIVGLYRKKITVPADWTKRHVYIHFEGVSFGHVLYVNGKLVGQCNQAFLPVQYDITPFLQDDGENLIAVKVFKDHRESRFDCNDAWALSGIFRDVYLFSPSHCHIDQYKIDTRINSTEQCAIVNGEVDIRCFRDSWDWMYGKWKVKMEDTLSLEIAMRNPAGEMVYHNIEEIEWANALMLPHHHFSFTVKNALFWNAEQPNLYQLTLSLLSGEEKIHTIHQRVGLREITIADGVLKVNGQQVKLKGVCRHEIHPDVGRALREEHWLEDLALMKAANINTIRCSHYPPHPRFLELCDEWGFYVLDEVPIGFGDENLASPDMLGPVLSRTNGTIARDCNHPSVIIWDIGNENVLTRNLEQAAQYAKQLDASRPILYPGGNFNGYLRYAGTTGHSHFVDIMATHYPPNDALEEQRDDETLPGPFIFTEINHALHDGFGDFQTKWEITQNTDKFAGAIIWLWADQGIKRKVDAEVIDSYKDVFALKENDQLSGDFWLNDSTIIDCHGVFGMDGIVYPDRTPQTDYFETRKIFSPVVINNDEVSFHRDQDSIRITVENRYDFTNLSRISGSWELIHKGKTVRQEDLILSCLPHRKQSISLPVSMLKKYLEGDLYLHFSFKDYNDVAIYEKSVFLHRKDAVSGVAPVEKNRQLVLKTGEEALFHVVDNKGNLLAQGPFIRVGRQPSMAEQVTYKKKKVELPPVSILKDASILNQTKQERGDTTILKVSARFASSRDTSITVLAHLTLKQFNGNIDTEFTLEPCMHNKVLLEFGLIWEVPNADRVKWLGHGPYPAYPYKQALNEHGIYELSSNDFFFNGNRMVVQKVMCPVAGKKSLVLCPQKKSDMVSWEKGKDGSILLTHNLLVGGKGTKFILPRENHLSDDVQKVSGQHRMVLLKNDNPW